LSASAREALANRDFEDAHRLLSEVLSVEPENAQAAALLEQVTEVLRQTAEQEERRRAEQQKRGTLIAKVTAAARGHVEGDRFEEALALVTRALEHYPHEAVLQNLRSEVAAVVE